MRRTTLWIVAFAALALLVVGWKTFWFLTDDAFIAFRYVSNSMLGHGYVWNAPPFLPVEGYTSFLWLLLLEGVWRTLGVPPPESANVLSLIFATASLVLALVAALRIPLQEVLRPWRHALLAAVALFIVTNRTFLVFSSSGLETALFNFLLHGWLFLLVLGPRQQPWFWALAATCTTLLHLTRPDGLLFTAFFVLAWGVALRGPGARRDLLLGLLPLLGVAAHLLWRHSFYGDWLPNTYYAKYTTPWPASGWRYAASFILEYGLVLWWALAIVWLLRAKRTWLRQGRGDVVATVALCAVVIHALYYTWIIGGDHFEYRVYSQLVPLVPLTAIVFLDGLRVRASRALLAMAVLLLIALPLPWTHWSQTRHLTERKDTYMLRQPVAPRFPGGIRQVAAIFDDLQDWLIRHHVGARHQAHKVFLESFQRGRFPARSQGETIGAEELPVLVEKAVGYPGWALPHVFVLDGLGLNDYVVARTPAPRDGPRLMAHERQPPPGYLESYRPNVRQERGAVRVYRRETPLTPGDVARLEEEWRRRERAGERTAPGP